MDTNKTEEEIREEVKAELEKEMEIKEEAKKELLEEQRKEAEEEYTKNRRKNTIFRLITKVFSTIIFLFLLFEVIIGYLDMSSLNEDKEPVFYFSTKVEKTDDKEDTIYDLGLYRIIKTVDSSEKKIILKPFFM